MVNSTDNELARTAGGLRDVTRLVRIYVAITVATIVALVIMSATAPRLATDHAWGHAIVVAAFAVLLPLRLRAARKGKAGAARAVTIIASVLLVVNVVEAAIPRAFPAWQRVEMIVIALLMAGIVGLLAGYLRRAHRDPYATARS
jgi:hypothetical protein